MKKNREELARIHKEKCRELKQIRAKMAENLGIELHQRECTYEGYCSGTCPACRSEELRLNAALLKKQVEEANLKGRVAAAGLTAVAALCLTGCNTPDRDVTEGVATMLDSGSDGGSSSGASGCDTKPWASDPGILEGSDTEAPEGLMEAPPETEEISVEPSSEMPGEYIELEGDVAYLPEEGALEAEYINPYEEGASGEDAAYPYEEEASGEGAAYPAKDGISGEGATYTAEDGTSGENVAYTAEDGTPEADVFPPSETNGSGEEMPYNVPEIEGMLPLQEK